MDETAVGRAKRETLRREFGELYASVSAILFEEDPIGINFGWNTDEYEPEVDTILPRLAGCVTTQDVCAVVHAELVRWSNGDIAGSPERYLRIAERILLARGSPRVGRGP